MKSFDEKTAERYAQWLATPRGRRMDARQKGLIRDIGMPRVGERVLDVGCGTGNHLLFFRELGCHVTGVEPSAALLEIAERRMGGKAHLRMGDAEDLPFSDNEFDVVSLIGSLELTKNPERALGEAIRVSGGRVFVGFLNKYSLAGIFKEIAGSPLYRQARFFSLIEMRAMVMSCMGPVDIRWESAPVARNPFGAFIGMVFPTIYRYRTSQNIIKDPFQAGVKGRREVQTTVRGFKSHAN